MAFTDRLRQQHDLATIMSDHLCDLVARHLPGDSTVAIATQLSRLHSLLRVHLAEEDEILYPALIAMDDRGAMVVAERFQAEMGSLAWAVEDFMIRWSSSSVIALDFAAFKVALGQLIRALTARIHCENATLYPIADALIPDRRNEAA